MSNSRPSEQDRVVVDRRPIPRRVATTRTAIVAVLVVGALAACSSTSTTQTTSAPAHVTTSAPSTAPAPAISFPPYNPVIDPSKFTNQITNSYFPLKPGTVYIMQGSRDGVPVRNEMTVTKETKTIMGVKCAVVRDIVTGALEERTTDWYAQDTSGNVWYFGEDTKEYTNGVVTSTAGTWTAGVNGALPGIIMLAKPQLGPPYRQEYRPGVAEDVAKVFQLGATAQVPSGSYTNVLITEDTDLLNPGKLEHKSFAPGVGMVAVDGMVNGHHEILQLTSILTTK